MADPKGFLKYDRELPRRRSVEERKHDWIEVYTDFPDAKLQRQAARCMDCGIPFCHQGCPLGNIIPDWNDLAYRGRWREALAELHATNNFPEFTGKLCPAPCESACVLGINQEPVAIRRIEESLAMRGWSEGWIEPEPPDRRTAFRVAVVGSGPAGLAAAQQLNRAGHNVTVFERDDRIGGLLRYGIPDFKMEKWVLDRRLRQMEAEGIAFRACVNVGVDITGDQLRADFDAIVLAGGSTVPRDLQVPGRDLDGIHFAMEFLPQQNRRLAGTAPPPPNPSGEPAQPTIPDGANPTPPRIGGSGGETENSVPISASVGGSGGERPAAVPQLQNTGGQEGEPEITAEGKHVVIIGGGDTGADCLG
ncbi:MAG TPA: glutamate synthase subunit beta, partial [Chthonomonadaceae bacterium]|nr:glutamate synthase subunit beta [Chthonomonadaceae bacterium]